MITYFQLSSAVYTAFPISLKANQAAGSTDATTAAATPVEQGNSSYTTTTTNNNNNNNGRSVFVVAMEAMQPAFDFVGNINLSILEFVNCMVGPRHMDRLSFAICTIIGVPLAIWVVVLLLQGAGLLARRCCSKSSPILAFANWLCRAVNSNLATTLSALVVFLVYPRATATILRSFVCTAYTGMHGGPTVDALDATSPAQLLPWAAKKDPFNTYWLEDDPSVQCELGESQYLNMLIVASVACCLIVIGCPLLQYMLLRRWRYPYNALHVPTDKGTYVPSEQGNAVLGQLYTFYRHHFWAMGSVDMLFKTLLAGFLGVVYQDDQVTGLALSSLACGIIAALYMTLQPFEHLQANYIAALAHFALAAMYVSSIAEVTAMEATLRGGVTTRPEARHVLDAAVMVLYLAPIVVGILDLVRIDKWRSTQRTANGCRRWCSWISCFDCREHPTAMYDHNVLARQAAVDAGRAAAFASFVGELSGVTRTSFVARWRQKNWKQTGTETQPARRVKIPRCRFCRWNRWDSGELGGRAWASQASLKGKGGGGGETVGGENNASTAFDEAVVALGQELRTQPLTVSFDLLIDAENCARKLSRMVFPSGGQVLHRFSATSSKGEPAPVPFAKLGHVMLSFAWVEQLRKVRVTELLCVLERASGRSHASMDTIGACRDTVLALLCPGTDFGSLHLMKLQQERRLSDAGKAVKAGKAGGETMGGEGGGLAGVGGAMSGGGGWTSPVSEGGEEGYMSGSMMALHVSGKKSWDKGLWRDDDGGDGNGERVGGVVLEMVPPVVGIGGREDGAGGGGAGGQRRGDEVEGALGRPPIDPMTEVRRLHAISGRTRSMERVEAKEEKGGGGAGGDPIAAIHDFHSQLVQLGSDVSDELELAV